MRPTTQSTACGPPPWRRASDPAVRDGLDAVEPEDALAAGDTRRRAGSGRPGSREPLHLRLRADDAGQVVVDPRSQRLERFSGPWAREDEVVRRRPHGCSLDTV